MTFVVVVVVVVVVVQYNRPIIKCGKRNSIARERENKPVGGR